VFPQLSRDENAAPPAPMRRAVIFWSSGSINTYLKHEEQFTFAQSKKQLRRTS
jgi:hypothetical protein